MKKYHLLFVIISILIFSLAFAQDKSQKSEDIFKGKWFGNVQYDVKLFDNKGRIASHHTSSLKNIIIISEEFDDEDAPSVDMLKSIGMDDHTAEWMSKMRNHFDGDAVYTGISRHYSNRKLYTTWKLINGTENIKISGHFFSNNRIWISSDSDVEIWLGTYSDELYAFSLGGAAWGSLILEGIDFEVKNSKLLINYEEVPLGGGKYDYVKITGEFCRTYIKKDTLGKTVHINEPIKTDEFTQREIVIPAVPEMPDSPYKIGDIIVVGNTECLFTSENELMLSSGEVISFVDKNWWESVDLDKVVSNEYEISDIEMVELTTKVEKLREEGHNFKVQSPIAVAGVRGTKFITKVEKDGATTLTVLDGEVEFSDTEKRKTVLVKKNQKSTINPGGLPSEPVSIDPKLIPKWWE